MRRQVFFEDPLIFFGLGFRERNDPHLPRLLSIDDPVGSDDRRQHRQPLCLRQHGAQLGGVPDVDHLCPRILQDIGDLRRAALEVYGHDDSAARKGGEVHRGPFGGVVAEDRHPIAPLNAHSFERAGGSSDGTAVVAPRNPDKAPPLFSHEGRLVSLLCDLIEKESGEVFLHYFPPSVSEYVNSSVIPA